MAGGLGLGVVVTFVRAADGHHAVIDESQHLAAALLDDGGFKLLSLHGRGVRGCRIIATRQSTPDWRSSRGAMWVAAKCRAISRTQKKTARQMAGRFFDWLRGKDLNLRPSGYEADLS